ncbi:MAG: hypothetical protein QOG70_1076 [Solirubrobacteraceae bacterium]|jgi:hypothetical protein|nr:hypothetical protein [Solirubrobacteraceae bacterium]
MPETETPAWWDEVAHLRDSIERRREDEARRGRRLRAREEATDDVDALAGVPGRRFERAGAEPTGRRGRARSPKPEPVVVSNPLTPPPRRRRTVEITGRTIGAPSLPRLIEIDRRRPPRRSVERIGPRPDRLALWAVMLAFFLILVAFTSASHAAAPPAPAHAAAVR